MTTSYDPRLIKNIKKVIGQARAEDVSTGEFITKRFPGPLNNWPVYFRGHLVEVVDYKSHYYSFDHPSLTFFVRIKTKYGWSMVRLIDLTVASPLEILANQLGADDE